MQDIKQNLADAIRKSRTELGLSQEKLAEILGFDSRTILNIENGRGNPKFEKLYPLVRHLNISADRIFYPESVTPQPNLQCSRSKFLSYFLIFFVKNFHITLFHFTEKRSYFFVVKQRFKEILYTDRG